MEDTKKSTYFFNDQYDDRIIRDSMFELYNQTYAHAMLTQDIIQRVDDITGTMNMFTVNDSINSKYNLPKDTYTHIINKNIIPYYNEKVYIDKYAYEIPIILTEIIKDKKTFNQRIKFRIDSYTFMNLRAISLKNNKTILCIYTGFNEGIMKEDLDILLDDSNMWRITFENQSDMYYTYLNSGVLFDGDLIPISRFTKENMVRFYKENMINSWTILISASENSPNLLSQSECKMIIKDNIQYFEVSHAFRTYIKKSAFNCKVFIIHNYYKTGSFVYNKTSGNLFDVPYMTNPVHINNVISYTYDKENDKENGIFDMDKISHYPNIVEMPLSDNDIISYYFESPHTHNKFDHSYKDYQDFLGDQYKYLLTMGTIHSEIKKYLTKYPLKEWKYDYDDYSASQYHGDIRAYNLSKLILLLGENTDRYNYFLSKINLKNKKIISVTIDESDIVGLRSREVYDNSDFTDDIEEIYPFINAQTYIEFSNSSFDPRSASLFVNGYRILPTLIFNKLDKTYIFFDNSLLKENSYVTIDMPLASSSMSVNKHSGSFLLKNSGDKVGFPASGKFGKVSGDNLVFFDAATKEYIDSNKLKIGMNVDEYYISHLDKKDIGLFGVDEEVLLITNDSLFYRTKDQEKISLYKDTVYIETGDIYFTKPIDSSQLMITTDDISLLTREIGVTNTNNFRVGKIHDLNTQKIFKMTNFREFPDADRFNVYSGGKILPRNSYIITLPTVYGGDVIFDLTGIIPDATNPEVIIEYLPCAENSEERNRVQMSILTSGPQDDTVMEGRPKVVTEFGNINNIVDIKNGKIYIDGKRINNKKIVQVPGINLFMVSGYVGEHTIMINSAYKDEDCYDYTITKEYNTCNNLYNGLPHNDPYHKFISKKYFPV